MMKNQTIETRIKGIYIQQGFRTEEDEAHSKKVDLIEEFLLLSPRLRRRGLGGGSFLPEELREETPRLEASLPS